MRRIPISRHRFALLSKRDTAIAMATASAKTALLIAQQAEEAARKSRESFIDDVSCLTAETGLPPAEYRFNLIAEDDGKYFIEVIEPPKQTSPNADPSE